MLKALILSTAISSWAEVQEASPLITNLKAEPGNQELTVGVDLASVWDRPAVQATPLLFKPATALWEKTKDVGSFAKEHPWLSLSPLLGLLAVRAIDKRLDDDVDKLGDLLSGRSSGSSGPTTPVENPVLFVSDTAIVRVKCVDVSRGIDIRGSDNVVIDNSKQTCEAVEE